MRKQPIFSEPKRTRTSKKVAVQYGRHNIYHLDNYKDTKEVRSKLEPDSISYDYIDIDKFIESSNSAKSSVCDYLKNLFILSDTPLRLCYERQYEGDFRKSSKKYIKNDDNENDWKHKKMRLPQGNIKRFQIVDNKHNSVRNSKFGSGENKGKKKGKKHKKHSSGSEDSKETQASSEEENRGRKNRKKKPKNSNERKQENSDETDIKHEDSASASFEKWKNYKEDSKSDKDIPKKKTKKKKKKHTKELEDTKRKTIQVEDTYFMQGNKIYHSTGKSKKKVDDLDKRRRLENFMPKRYHWDPSEIHNLGYYWFNGPKGLHPEPKPLSN